MSYLIDDIWVKNYNNVLIKETIYEVIEGDGSRVDINAAY